MSAIPPASHVLVADDEPGVLRFVSHALTRAGFRVTTAEDGTTAGAMLADPNERFVAAVLDCSMPGATGPEVVSEMRRGGNPLPVVLLSGDEEYGRSAAGDAAVRLLAKPCSVAELVGAVRDLLAGAAV